MKFSCPSCDARYTVSDERLQGRRATVRCKRCGEAIVLAPTASLREESERRGAGADLFGAPEADDAGDTPVTTRRAPLTGERNENSVLFSLATLARSAPPEPTTSVTESSSLIDLRALCAPHATSEATSSRVEDIMSLAGGGAFAPLVMPPIGSFTATEIAADARPSILRHKPLVLALAATAVVGAAALAIAWRGAKTGEAVAAPVSSYAPPPTIPATAPSATEETPSNASVATTSAGSTSPPKPPRVTPVARPQGQAPDPKPAASTSPTAAPIAKCCPGESETACQMRLSVGAPCGGSPNVATTSTAPPLDRAAATRALGVSVASCKREDGPTGPGHVKVTFQPNGSASAVEVEPPYAGTQVGACVAQRFRSVTIPAFAGGPLTLGKAFNVP